MAFRSDSHTRRTGNVLIMVLGLIVMLSLILLSFLEHATERIRYSGQFYQQDELRSVAQSALNITIACLGTYAEIDGDLYSPEQGWAEPLKFADINWDEEAIAVAVSIQPENNRFPLATADLITLRIAFDQMGIPLQEQQILGDTLLDWQDADADTRLNGFDGTDYEEMTPPYQAPNRAVKDWDEFKLIKGWNTLFWDENGFEKPSFAQFKSLFSLHSIEAVNLNALSPEVWAMLEQSTGIDSQPIRTYLDGLDGIPHTADDRYFTTTSDSLLASLEKSTSGKDDNGATFLVSSSTFNISILVKRGDATFSIQALVNKNGGQAGTKQASIATDMFKIIQLVTNRMDKPPITTPADDTTATPENP
jgi:hypothetical protein